MMNFKSADGTPGLLVSVRSAFEALEALAGGADVIDVKEPSRGSLGAADATTIAEIVRAVNGRTIVTAALGELDEVVARDSQSHLATLPEGISLYKLGLSGCREKPNWTSLWHNAIGHSPGDRVASASRAVAVVYADWTHADSPEPLDVLNAAIEARCPALLVDTWDKSSGTLFDHWPTVELRCFAADVRSHGIALVLAGSLAGAAICEAARLGPELIAVRAAACLGGRDAAVSRDRVRALKQSIEGSARRRTSWLTTG